MGSSHINLPLPLTRLNAWYPGQVGIQGTSTRTGLRTTCEGVVFYVDPNAVGVSDQRDGTDVEAPLATVAAALTKCLPYRGDTILVMANNAWQYNDVAEGRVTPVNEAVIVTVPGVRIVGVCPSSSIGVPWHVPVVTNTAITVLATDVLIEGFVFTGANAMTAIDARWTGVAEWGDGLTVRHCVFDDVVTTGIRLEFAYNVEIHDCRFDDCVTYGIFADPADSAVAFAWIHDNWFTDVGTTAISLAEAVDSEVYNNRFYNATAVAAGAAVNCMIDTNAGARNLVHGNVMSCLLPVPANGDYNDVCSGSATDAWVDNRCLNGVAVTTPT